MIKSFSLVRPLALVSVVATFWGCSSRPAQDAPSSNPVLMGPGGKSTGTVGTGSTTVGSPENPGSPGTVTSGGTSGSGQAGTTAVGQAGDGAMGQGGSNGAAAAAVGGSDSGQGNTGPVGVGGGTEDTGVGGGSRDITSTGGVAGSSDIGTGQAGSRDITGQAGSSDITGQAGSRDIPPPEGGSSDIIGGAGGSGDIPPPPPPPPPPPGCIPSWFANMVNILVLGDAKFTGADTRGGIWVEGNLTSTVGYDVGYNLTTDCNRYDLVVGGDVSIGGWLVLKNGSAAYGGTWDATGVQGPCGAFPNPANMPDFAAIEESVKSYSATLASYPSNPGNVVEIPSWSAGGAGAVLTGGTAYVDPNTNKQIFLFNTDLCTFNNTVINVPVGSTVIINSTCTDVVFSGGEVKITGMDICNAQDGTGDGCNHILYNFPNAETINVTGTTVQGSILAPDAKLTGGGGAFAGQLVIGSIDTSIEFHTYFFEGCIELPALSG